jgi:hypothetical protein
MLASGMRSLSLSDLANDSSASTSSSTSSTSVTSTSTSSSNSYSTVSDKKRKSTERSTARPSPATNQITTERSLSAESLLQLTTSYYEISQMKIAQTDGLSSFENNSQEIRELRLGEHEQEEEQVEKRKRQKQQQQEKEKEEQKTRNEICFNELLLTLYGSTVRLEQES